MIDQDMSVIERRKRIAWWPMIIKSKMMTSTYERLPPDYEAYLERTVGID